LTLFDYNKKNRPEYCRIVNKKRPKMENCMKKSGGGCGRPKKIPGLTGDLVNWMICFSYFRVADGFQRTISQYSPYRSGLYSGCNNNLSNRQPA